MRLYEIANEYERLFNALSELDGATPEMIEDTLITIKEPLEEKIINIAAYIKNTDAEIKAMREYEKSMAERRRRFENRNNNLKRYIKETMERTGLKKIKGSEFDVSIRKNPLSVSVIDESIVPDDYVKLERKIDKVLIRDAIKCGKDVPGAHLDQTTSIIIG